MGLRSLDLGVEFFTTGWGVGFTIYVALQLLAAITLRAPSPARRSDTGITDARGVIVDSLGAAK